MKTRNPNQAKPYQRQWKRALGALAMAEPQLRIPVAEIGRKSLASILCQYGRLFGMHFFYRQCGEEYWVWRVPAGPRQSASAQMPSAS